MRQTIGRPSSSSSSLSSLPTAVVFVRAPLPLPLSPLSMLQRTRVMTTSTGGGDGRTDEKAFKSAAAADRPTVRPPLRGRESEGKRGLLYCKHHRWWRRRHQRRRRHVTIYLPRRRRSRRRTNVSPLARRRRRQWSSSAWACVRACAACLRACGERGIVFECGGGHILEVHSGKGRRWPPPLPPLPPPPTCQSGIRPCVRPPLSLSSPLSYSIIVSSYRPRRRRWRRRRPLETACRTRSMCSFA